LRVRAKICESILEGLTLADAAALAGVSRQTVNEWRRRGEEEPDSLYGEFSEAFELAKLQSKKGMTFYRSIGVELGCAPSLPNGVTRMTLLQV
jgi:hypothetical protein